MGCCFSRPPGANNSPYPGGGPPSSSARAINPPTQTTRPPTASVPASVSASVPGATRGIPNSDSEATATSAPSSPTTIGSHDGEANPAAGTAGNAASLPLTTPAMASASASASTPASPSWDAAAASPVSAASPTLRHVHTLSPATPAQLAQPVNRPLQRHPWTSRSRIWTRRTLDRERTDYFDTRVTGRAEIWQTLRAVLEILWTADLGAVATPETTSDVEEARATAQTILDAAGITLPTGNMAQGAYDAFGHFYPLPAWIVSDPVNMVEEEEDDGDDYQDNNLETKTHADAVGGETLATSSESSDDGQSNEAQDRRRAAKGKAILNDSGRSGSAGGAADAHTIMVRARLSATGRDVVLRVGREESVRSLAYRMAEAAQLLPPSRIRVAYMGKILKEGISLTAQGWREGHVVNALVFETTASGS